ncbi:MAG: iron ABC transporter [Desulfitibacter sp. BRH_c19]|nr:MAG: iron ABC transporter [Desulfitibacter sp. BRH_c19]
MELVDKPENPSVQLKSRPIGKIVFLAILLIFVCLTAVTIGPADITLGQTVKILLSEIPVLGDSIVLDDVKVSQQTIVLQIRFPRILLAALVGIALATVGATFQGLLKNPMADPYIIGVSSGAALGATIAIVTGLSAVLGYFAVPWMAFIGALISTYTVYNIARVGNSVPVYTLLLAGVALSAFMSAIMSFLMVLNSNEMQQIMFWLLGSFSARNWGHVQAAAPLILIGVVIINCFTRELNVMLFGDHTAQHLGIDAERTKKLLLTLGAFTAAAAVSVSGTIGFVGLIIPHGVRLVVGPDHRALMPISALVGGIFMVATDTFARTLLGSVEIPVGIITAMLGGPFFIYLLKRKKGSEI